jgi:hypothetical protein
LNGPTASFLSAFKLKRTEIIAKQRQASQKAGEIEKLFLSELKVAQKTKVAQIVNV